ncbi:MAG: cytochrome c family protein [Sphingomonadaceae bacterium]|jgi:cytochrome c|nr:cytochrome c family protein [Sphingomonadaceae bacterium]
MDENRFNTIAGWTLFSGVVALGLASVSSHYFKAGKDERPEKMGYEIEGVVQEGEGAAAAVPLEVLLASADAAKGEASFKKCASCHTINAGGANGIGPNLHEIMGDGVAQGRAGFAFSDALKTHGGKWDWATMDAWLKNPKAFAPGTKMSFAGIGDAQERANLLVYLNSQGSNLPLPAAPAAPAADAAAAPADGAAAAPAEGAAAAPAAAEPAKK